LVEKAQGRPASASSADAADRAAAKANDGSMATRWSSAYRDGEWWQVDLGTKQDVQQVKTSWEYAYAAKFRVQTSADGTTWTAAADDAASGAGERTTTFARRDARFVRITGLTRGTQYGISLHEVKVLGVAGATGTTPPPAQPTVQEPEPVAPAPTPTPGTAVKAVIEFAKGNPFTTPLSAGAPLLPAAEQVARRNEVKVWMSKSATGIEQRNWSSSLYLVFRNGEIRDTEGDLLCKGPLVTPTGGIARLNAGIDGKGWPTASCLDPEDGEGHIALWSPETGAYADFYGAKIGSSISYAYGGAIPDTRTAKLMASFGSTSTQWQGGVAAGVPLWGTYVTEKEIRDAVKAYQAGNFAQAYIPHVLAYEAYRHTPNTWEYPASKTDFMGTGGGKVSSYGVGGDPNYGGHGRGVIPMGGIWRVDPKVDVFTQVKGDGTAHGDMLARIFARTLQLHGATMTDYTGGGFVFLAEQASHQTMFDYKNGSSNSAAWVKGLLTQSIDQGWMQFVNTGRNMEVDLGQPAQPGTYRPPTS
ncbi:MAG TPA: discoidin domain-containing protein, partial [Solirubrobacteraceae bacterium]|nr:discoidin domain-containing protein [Solirubrobacteraceae bacterium]